MAADSTTTTATVQKATSATATDTQRAELTTPKKKPTVASPGNIKLDHANAKKTKSKMVRSGLMYPVARVDRSLRAMHAKRRTSPYVSIYLAAVLEHIINQAIDRAVEYTKQQKRCRLSMKDLQRACLEDPMLSRITSGHRFIGGGCAQSGCDMASVVKHEMEEARELNRAEKKRRADEKAARGTPPKEKRQKANRGKSSSTTTTTPDDGVDKETTESTAVADDDECVDSNDAEEDTE
jgi:histone H3/H4